MTTRRVFVFTLLTLGFIILTVGAHEDSGQLTVENIIRSYEGSSISDIRVKNETDFEITVQYRKRNRICTAAIDINTMSIPDKPECTPIKQVEPDRRHHKAPKYENFEGLYLCSTMLKL